MKLIYIILLCSNLAMAEKENLVENKNILDLSMIKYEGSKVVSAEKITSGFLSKEEIILNGKLIEKGRIKDFSGYKITLSQKSRTKDSTDIIFTDLKQNFLNRFYGQAFRPEMPEKQHAGNLSILFLRYEEGKRTETIQITNSLLQSKTLFDKASSLIKLDSKDYNGYMVFILRSKKVEEKTFFEYSFAPLDENFVKSHKIALKTK